MITRNPTIEEMSEWTDSAIGMRAVLLALVCADRRDRKDEAWSQADKELTRMVPLINERFGN